MDYATLKRWWWLAPFAVLMWMVHGYTAKVVLYRSHVLDEVVGWTAVVLGYLILLISIRLTRCSHAKRAI